MLDEVEELGAVSVLDEALASGSELELTSELQLVLRLALVLVLVLRLRCTTPTRSSYMKDNPRRR